MRPHDCGVGAEGAVGDGGGEWDGDGNRERGGGQNGNRKFDSGWDGEEDTVGPWGGYVGIFCELSQVDEFDLRKYENAEAVRGC